PLSPAARPESSLELPLFLAPVRRSPTEPGRAFARAHLRPLCYRRPLKKLERRIISVTTGGIKFSPTSDKVHGISSPGRRLNMVVCALALSSSFGRPLE